MRTLAALILLGLTAAAVAPSPDLTELEGTYAARFEHSDFIPCGSPAKGPYWVTLDPTALRQRDSILAEMHVSSARSPLYVKIRAAVGAEGQVGHMGRYTRYIHVGQVMAVDTIIPARCETSTRFFSLPR